MALAAAGVSADDASFTTAGLDRRNGTDFYAVDFTAGGENYEYDIDAVTGVIISSQSSAAQGGDLTGGDDGQAASPGTDNPQDPTPAPAGQNPTSNPTTAPSQAPSRNPATQSPDAYIGEERAKEIALEHAGLAAGDVTFLKTRLDRDDGRLEYEGKIIYNGMEYEFEIDGYSGSIRSWESEPTYRR